MSFLDRFKRKGQEEPLPSVTPPHAPEAPRTQPQTPAAAGQGLRPHPAMTKPEPAVKKPVPAKEIALAKAAEGYNPEFILPRKKEKAQEPLTTSSTPPETAPQPLAAGPPQELVLELGDFLPRIPAQLLVSEAKPDPRTILRFDVGEIADRIARGQTTLPLVDLYKRVPAIFRNEILQSDSIEIRFPWQKVMKALADIRAGITSSPHLTPEAAASLAENLRSRRVVRNIGQSAPAQEAPRLVPAAPTAPNPPAAEAEAGAAPKVSNLVAMPLPSGVPAPSTPEDDERLTREELIRTRNAAQNALARIRGEYERQASTIEAQRKSLSDEKEKLAAELARAKKEAEDKAEQAEFEKSVTAKSAERLSKAVQERDTLQRELTAIKTEFTKDQQSERRIAELVAEKEALAQQQATLSKQVAEFQKRGKLGAIIGAEAQAAAAAAGGLERSPKEGQRQIEELQRRITVLETGQRESAQELGRERELRIKVERQLSTSDRLKQESAVQVEEGYASLRREFETATRKREAEVARAQKEAGEQIEAIQAEKAKLAAELDHVRTQAALAPAAVESTAQEWEARAVEQLESDIESYRTRIKKLIQERDAANAEKESLEARMASVSTGEAAREVSLAAPHAEAEELQKLREELSAALRDRENLSAKAAALEQKLTDYDRERQTALEAVKQAGATAEQLAQAEMARNTAEDLVAALRTGTEQLHLSHEQLSRKLEETEKSRAEIEKLRASAPSPDQLAEAQAAQKRAEDALSDLWKENEQIAAKLAEAEKARGIAEQIPRGPTPEQLAEVEVSKKASEEALVKLRSENEKLSRELEAKQSLEGSAAAVAAENARLSQELESARATSSTGITEVRAEAEKLVVERDAAIKEREALLAEIDSLRSVHTTEREKLGLEHSAAVAAAEARLTELQAAHDKVLSDKAAVSDELSVARNAHYAFSAEAVAARSAQEKAYEELDKEREYLRRKLQSVSADLMDARQQHQVAVHNLAAERDGIRSANETLAAESAATKAQLEKTLAEQKAANAQLQANLESLTVELGKTKQGQEQALAAFKKERAETDEAKQALLSGHAEAKAALENSLLQARAANTDLQTRFDALTKELANASQSHTENLAALRKQYDDAAAQKESLAAQLAQALATHETLQAEAAVAKAAHQNAYEEVDKEREMLRKKLQTLSADFSNARQQQEIAYDALRSDHEQLLAARDALLNEHAAARTQSEKALADAAVAKAQAQARIESLNKELEDVKYEHAQNFSALEKDRDSLRSTRDSLAAQLSKALNSREAIQNELIGARATHEKSLAEITGHRDDLQSKFDALKKDYAGALDLHAKTSAELTAQRDKALAEREDLAAKSAAEIEEARREHALAISALDKDRDLLRADQRVALEEMEKLKATHADAMGRIQGRLDSLLEAKAALERVLAEAHQNRESLRGQLRQAESGIKQRDTDLAKLRKDHLDTLAEAAGKHERALIALRTEKDAALATITAEKASLASALDEKTAALQKEHTIAMALVNEEKDRAIAALTAESSATLTALAADRDKVRAALVEAQRKHPSEIAALYAERDSARQESIAVAQRLADAALEHDQRTSVLKGELDAIRGEKDKLLEALSQAVEEHKAQSGIFSRELKALIKQRDEAVAQSEAERANYAEKLAAVASERANLARTESEMTARFERETARFRRERDSVVQQRDALRARVQTMIEQQNHILDEVSVQPSQTGSGQRETPVTESSPAPKSNPARTVQRKGKESSSKAKPTPKRVEDDEGQVIDIEEAQIVESRTEDDGRLKIPRVRPVPIPPPQVRIL